MKAEPPPLVGSMEPPQGLAVTPRLVEIRCAAWDLCNDPATDCSAECRHLHLQEEVT
jgi:hypothetical protein